MPGHTLPVTARQPSSGTSSTTLSVSPLTDVTVSLVGGYDVVCECGRRTHTNTESAGWTWVLEHACSLDSDG